MFALAAAGSLINIGAGIGQAVAGRKGERDAINAQKDAINQLEAITRKQANDIASSGDIAFYEQSMAEFRKRNPGLATARDATEATLKDLAVNDPLAETRALLDQRIKEAQNTDPNAAAARSELLRQTRRNLELGASLPPEYQAELVRAGLEQGRVTGAGGNRLGPATQLLGNKIGAAGLELEQQRQQAAATALQLDDALTRGRQAILGDLVSQSATVPAAQVAMAERLRGIAGSEIPSVGLSGTDLLGIEQERIDLENRKKLALGNLDAQNQLSQAKRTSGIIGSVSSGLSGGMGAMSAGGSGGGGGLMSIFGNLFQKNNGPQGRTDYQFNPQY